MKLFKMVVNGFEIGIEGWQGPGWLSLLQRIG
jgi:hypothetical protein